MKRADGHSPDSTQGSSIETWVRVTGTVFS